MLRCHYAFATSAPLRSNAFDYAAPASQPARYQCEPLFGTDETVGPFSVGHIIHVRICVVV